VDESIVEVLKVSGFEAERMTFKVSMALTFDPVEKRQNKLQLHESIQIQPDAMSTNTRK
jgi:hypothetical protein